MINFTPNKHQIFGNDKPFRLALYAASNSGKSFLIKEMLTNESWGLSNKYHPDRIYIFNPSAEFDDSCMEIIQDLEDRSTEEHKFHRDRQVFDKDIETALSTVYKDISNEQKAKKKSGMEQDHTLFLLDDIMGIINLGSSTAPIGHYLTRARHQNISFIVGVQHMKSMAPLSRNQISHSCFFNCPNSKEISKIKEEVSGGLPNRQFDEIYKFCTGEPFSYMMCVHNFPEKYRFFKGKGSDLVQLEI